jgi:gluconate 2-dehydrogenase gamma chain
MESAGKLSRRHFLQSAGSLSGAAYLRLASPALIAITESACTAKRDAAPFNVLLDREATDFAAIAARLIPTTDTPGATEAGVIYFIDNAFADAMRGLLDGARAGLEHFNAALAMAHPGADGLASLATGDQDAFLATQEDSEFFELAWLLTVFGFFAMPKHGGNRNYVAWDLIGFEGHHGAWQYPFGHYDAAVHEGGTDGE